MEKITFDTHKFVKRLLSEGFTEGQAEALTEEYKHLLAARFENLSTKQDVVSFATKQDFEKVATKLENIEICLENCATIQDLGNFATKQDFEKVATKLENIEICLENCATIQDLNELRGDVRVAIAEVQQDTIALKDRLNIFMGIVFLVLGWIVIMLMRMG